MPGQLLQRADKRHRRNRPGRDVGIEVVDVLKVLLEGRGHDAGETRQRITNAAIIGGGAGTVTAPSGVISPGYTFCG